MNNAYRRWAHQQLSLLTDSSDDILKLPVLLKKTAIYAYKRKDVAELIGHDWELWLDSECSQTEFSKSPNSGLLSEISYSQSPKLSSQQFAGLKQQIGDWIKYHKGAL